MHIYYGFDMVSLIVVAGFIVGCYRCTAATASGTATNLPFVVILLSCDRESSPFRHHYYQQYL